MDIQRRLNLPELLKKKSFFLLGPRGTGKTTLIRQQLAGQATLIDLLQGDIALRLAARPETIEEIVTNATHPDLVVIDEIQKLPHLLDEVHRLIETKKVRFLLTGSSARKLKARGTNLLAGRAWMAHLFPLSWSEIPNFDLDRYLLYGGLPSVYVSENPPEELKAYVHTYLSEEIRGEALIRKIPAFSRFLEVAALSNGELLNFTSLGSDSQVQIDFFARLKHHKLSNPVFLS
jgi:predicted AAA+ superfamily ATPase